MSKPLSILFIISFLSLFSQTSSAKKQHSPDDKRAVISIGADVAQTLNEQFSNTLDIKVSSLKSANSAEYSILSIPESQINQLSQIIHKDFHRCPGFFFHESAEEAKRFHQQSKEAVHKNVDYTINNADTANALLSQLTRSNMASTVTSLSDFYNRYYQVQSGVEASNWIKDQWTEMSTSRSDISVELFEHTNWAQPSVIATITGTTTPNEVVVIGGHLDSINGGSPSSGRAPGADDNASGIAVITEALNTIIATGYKPARTVMIMGYAEEEVGLRG